MDYLRSEATDDGQKVAFMGDDGEKFGLWPGTYEHCWANGWMERFFQAIEANSDWLTIIPPGDFARQFPSIGRVYLPTASYDEMTEWALPAERSGEMVALKHRLDDEGCQDVLRFIKGGFWRNFMVKYPEINTLHKKMLLVSRKVWKMKDGDAKQRALDHLWHGQCNCPYWHGVFGGIYLFHIRTANFRHLIAAEVLADAMEHEESEWLDCCEPDFDGDAAQELLLSTDSMNLYFAPSTGGRVFEWDWRAKECNLLNTLTRRREGYHQELVEAGKRGAIVLPGQSAGELESIHTTVIRAKEPDLDQKLFYDWYRRNSLIDHFFHSDTNLETFYRAEYGECGDFVDRPYVHEVDERADGVELRLSRDGHVWQQDSFAPLRVEKRVQLARGSTDTNVGYKLTNSGSRTLSLRFGVETNWAMLGGNGPHAHYTLPGSERLPLDARHETEAAHEIRLVLEWKGMDVGLHVSRPTTFWCFPLETISNSEAGFERVYQGSSVTAVWDVNLEPGSHWEVGLLFTLQDIG
jgi:alpha-amylase